ncbi:MAG: oligosaccharide flippase family protein, partial [Clostridiales bacterium]|nr:oligosaccharide flippase family protein [Clostridiales bacterium]
MKKDISDSSQRKVGLIMSYAQIAISSLISILYTPIMIRTLGQNEYGLYGTVSSFVGMLSLLNLGFSSSYIKFYSTYKIKNQEDKIRSFNSLFFYVFAVIAALALIIGLFFSFNLNLVFDEGLTSDEYSKARIMMIMLTISMALGFITTVFSCYIGANQRYIFSKGLSLASSIINVVVQIIILFSGGGAVGLVAFSLASSIIIQLINIIYCYKKLDFAFDFKHIEKGLFKKFFSLYGLIDINLIFDKINTG